MKSVGWESIELKVLNGDFKDTAPSGMEYPIFFL